MKTTASAKPKTTVSRIAPVKLSHKAAQTNYKQPPIAEARRIIEAQIADFLKAGGKINQIAQGVSGQLNISGPKNIAASKKTIQKTN